MDRKKILLVEDNDMFRKALSDSLRGEYEVNAVGDAESALESVHGELYDLIITDVGLPKMDGFKLCANIKSQDGFEAVPIIFLTGKSDVEDKLIGFSVGASDYVNKNCDPREFRARVRAMLKRPAVPVKMEQFDIGPFRCNLATQRISYEFNGVNRIEMDLSPLEFRLLHYLLSHADHVLSRHQLLDHVWGGDRNVNDRSVDVAMSKLRLKLGPHANLLKTIRGEGYRFCKAA